MHVRMKPYYKIISMHKHGYDFKLDCLLIALVWYLIIFLVQTLHRRNISAVPGHWSCAFLQKHFNHPDMIITIIGFRLKFTAPMKLRKCFGYQHFSATKHDTWHCDLNTLCAFGAALRRHLLNCEKWWAVNCHLKRNITKQNTFCTWWRTVNTLKFLFRARTKI